jgi:hypothetical protein
MATVELTAENFENELITKARELDMDEVRASIAEHEAAQQAGSA